MRGLKSLGLSVETIRSRSYTYPCKELTLTHRDSRYENLHRNP